jgi:hypothetical protein
MKADSGPCGRNVPTTGAAPLVMDAPAASKNVVRTASGEPLLALILSACTVGRGEEDAGSIRSDQVDVGQISIECVGQVHRDRDFLQRPDQAGNDICGGNGAHIGNGCRHAIVVAIGYCRRLAADQKDGSSKCALAGVDRSKREAANVVGGGKFCRAVNELDRIIVYEGAGVPVGGGAPVSGGSKSSPGADNRFCMNRQTQAQACCQYTVLNANFLGGRVLVREDSR